MTRLAILHIALVSGIFSTSALAQTPGGGAEEFLDRVRTPFWTSTTQVEPLFFIQQSADQRPQAKLLFPATTIARLTSADRTTTYEAGRDYTLGEEGVVSLPEGSRIPFKTLDQLYPLMTSNEPRIRGRRGDETRGILFGEGAFYHALQAEVTYDAKEARWDGPRPEYAGERLPRLTAKLKAKQPVHILVCGDSISAGGNASKVTKASPGCPAFPELVAGALGRANQSDVTLTNVAVGGWTSDQGLKQAQDDRPAKGKQPDLVIIAFGMNDVGRRDVARYRRNIEGIISEVRKDAPEAEFLLVATMLGNKEWFLPMDQFPIYRDALVELQGPGIAVADLTAMWDGLQKRKSFYDLTGNGVNHPNDFGHLVYGQVIFGTLYR
ncbi:GDSL-like Lipase/Acylhydrolase [Caulifigura coniformis]|uniref:GDSL-like Lipase/Acylhydrolase n=1 Tax=Caulifigura coniformis TaxID=2527983 RepID=A0A517SDM8_9PLAN|nr:SGNH/GDSL hydrolase family protein [Caulifigura coniformis]QDT54232.1 GDSL-like Lipase/Acylhydrolase [Caulifigura coniformis]